MSEHLYQQPPQPPPAPPPAPPQWKKHGALKLIIVVGILASFIWLVSCSAIVRTLGGTDTATAPTTMAPAPAEGATTTEAEPTEEPEPEPSNCKRLKKSQLREITAGREAGTTVRAKSGVLVPLTDDYQFGFNQIIALKLTNGSAATFATENLGKEDNGLLLAVNGPAKRYFVWGAAVRPGSPMDDDLQAIKDSLEYDEAVGCVKA